MPLYIYEAIEGGCKKCASGWEELQDASAEPLRSCPECGAEVRKVPAGFNQGRADVLSKGNLRDHGFQKLKRTDEGGYRRET